MRKQEWGGCSPILTIEYDEKMYFNSIRPCLDLEVHTILKEKLIFELKENGIIGDSGSNAAMGNKSSSGGGGKKKKEEVETKEEKLLVFSSHRNNFWGSIHTCSVVFFIVVVAASRVFMILFSVSPSSSKPRSV